jgi:hypothetical protein
MWVKWARELLQVPSKLVQLLIEMKEFWAYAKKLDLDQDHGEL